MPTDRPESPAATPRRDPRVRKDGLCAGCRKPRTAHRLPAKGKKPGAKTATRMDQNLWLSELAKDPWCSSRCCRRYHGVVYQSDEAGDKLTESRARAGRQSADRFRKAAA